MSHHIEKIHSGLKFFCLGGAEFFVGRRAAARRTSPTQGANIAAETAVLRGAIRNHCCGAGRRFRRGWSHFANPRQIT